MKIATQITDGRPSLTPKKTYRMEPGVCSFCDRYRDDPMMPPHTASAMCESGHHNHCTCALCY